MQMKSYVKVPPAPCACGCGQIISRMMHNGRIRTFKPGHHKVKDGKPRHSEIFKCKGCDYVGMRRGRKTFHSKECYWKYQGWWGRDSFEVLRAYQRTDRSSFNVVRSARIQRIYMLAACDNKCEQCGWAEEAGVLEVHHVNHNKRDGRRENMKLLCPTCHEMTHFKEKSGKYDKDRYKRANNIAQKFLASGG